MERSSLTYDVVIVGAGAAGLMAAYELSLTGKKILIVESSARTGGRIFSFPQNDMQLPVELGAEFVHGDLEITKLLVKRSGGELEPVKGSIWNKIDSEFKEQKDFIENYKSVKRKFDQLDHDLPVYDFLNVYLTGDEFESARISIMKYVEGYYAADLKIASTKTLFKEWENSSDKQYRIKQGYGILVHFLEKKLKETGVDTRLNTTAREINYSKDIVEINTDDGNVFARRVLVTASLGVLKKKQIRFVPELKEHLNAVEQLGYGGVIKLILHFKEAFWKDANKGQLHDLSFIFSEEPVPTWWSKFPDDSPVITGWIAGPAAKKMDSFTNEQIISSGILSLATIFDRSIEALDSLLVDAFAKNWCNDPNYYGGYSFEVVNGDSFKQILKKPIDNRLFFAGEALTDGIETGTVEAALHSGRETAFMINSTL